MKIRMTRAHGGRKPGDVMEMSDGQASLWLSLGFAVVERDAEEIETATVEQRTETADAPRKLKRSP